MDGARDCAGEARPDACWEIVPHAIDDEQFGAGDRGRGGLPAAEGDDGVGRAVDDEGGHADAVEALGAIGGDNGRVELAARAERVEATVVRALGGPAQPRVIVLERR
jgi:hypothetical protein